jgi:hypothetical protein
MGQADSRQLLKHYLLCTILFSSLFLAPSAVYRVHASPKLQKPAQASFESRPREYSHAEIDEITAGTKHPYILRTLIKCESENTNVARLDSNHLMSYGLLQFNGTATWQEYSPLASVSGTPMNPIDAVKVADWMISHGQLKRWSCAKLTGLL